MSVDDTRLIIFAKVPRVGEVKTRLTRSGVLNSTQARALYDACIREVWRKHALDRMVSLYVNEFAYFWDQFDLPPTQLKLQQGVDLGEKMYQALEEELCLDVKAALIIGTDCPQLSTQDLDEAFLALLQAQEQNRPMVSYGPAGDGGYVWVGLNRCALADAKDLFLEMVWSTDTVLNESLARAHKLSFDVHLGKVTWDLDEVSDLERLFHERNFTSPMDRIQLGGGFDAFELAPPHDPDLALRYHQGLSRLYELTRFGERMDLETPKKLNEILGYPLNAYQSILIGGTNGKGSTTAHLSALAEQADLRVGRFSSPHLISFRERITVGGRVIPYLLLIEGIEHVFQRAECAQITMSFFEATWALAAWCFRELKVSWVIWEVGLGGRLDATNVCDPMVSAITSIGLDHMHVLGHSLHAIATEKAWIAREGRPAFTGATGEGAQALATVAPQFQNVTALTEIQLKTLGNRLHPQNAALALAIAQAAQWNLTYQAKLEALKRFEWPGRLEFLCGMVLDCAHNPHAMQGLVTWLQSKRQQNPHLRVRCLFGASRDKDIAGVIDLLAPQLDELIWVSAQYPRCMSGKELKDQFEDSIRNLYPTLIQSVHTSIADALEELESTRDLRKDIKELDLVTGSCFVVGEARAVLLGLPFPEASLHTIAR